MNWDRIEGNWKQFKGKVKEQWGKLADSDLDLIKGRRDQLVGKIQEQYGISKDEADRQVGEFADRQRDYEQKLLDYAEAQIAEYWIVDFERQIVLVHRLEGDRYTLHGEFTRSQQATSVLLDGFAVDVEALFVIADDIPE